MEKNSGRHSLASLALFSPIERCDIPGSFGFVPMTLPLGADEPSVPAAMSASSLVARRGETNPLEDLISANVMSVLASARDEAAPQIGGSGKWLPRGFPHGATHVMCLSNSVDRCLLTPLMKPFSTDRKWNNLRCRGTTKDDLLPLFRVLCDHSTGNGFSASGLDASGKSLSFPQLLSAVISLMDQFAWSKKACSADSDGDSDIDATPGDFLEGFEGLFRLVSLKMFPNVPLEDHLSAPHLRLMHTAMVGSAYREQLYWLAFNQCLRLVTPVVLSPVGVPTLWLSLLLRFGSLNPSPSRAGDLPLLCFAQRAGSSGLTLCQTKSQTVVVTFHSGAEQWTPAPGDVSQDSLDEHCGGGGGPLLRDAALQQAVRALCRKSFLAPQSILGLCGRPAPAQR